MSEFLTDLDTRLKGDKIRILNNPLIYRSDILGCDIEAPMGFETDFSSVPRVPIVYSFWGGKAHREGVIHNYLFRSDSIPIVSFSMANKVFKEAMKSRGKSVFIQVSRVRV